MAKKLNKNLVGALILLGMVLMAATGIVLLKNLPGQDPTKYAADAESFKEEGDYKRAMQTFARAFSKDPSENPMYLVEAADCAIEAGDLSRARKFIGGAKVRDARFKPALQIDLELEFEIANLYSNSAQWSQVLESAKEMLSLDENSESAFALHAMGAAYLQLRAEDVSYVEKGLAALRRANELDPGKVEVIETLTGEYWRSERARKADGKLDEAEAFQKSRALLIETGLANHQGSDDEEDLAKLKRLQARYMVLEGSTEEGLALLERLAKEEKTRTNAHLLLASLYLGGAVIGIEPNVEVAERNIEEALAIEPKNGQIYEMLARVYQYQRSTMTDAEETAAITQKERDLYERGLETVERSKHFRELQNNRSRVAFIEGLFMQELRSAATEKDAAQKESYLQAAEAWIEKLKDEVSGQSFEVRFLTARLFYARGEVVAATREAEAAKQLAQGRSNLALEKLLTDLYTSQGQWGAARESLEQAFRKTRNDPGLYVAMGRILLREGRAAEALRYLKPSSPDEVRKALAKDRGAIALSIDAYRQLKQFELAAEASRQLGESSPDDALRQAAIMAWEERYDDAEAKIKEVLKNNPKNQSAIRALLSLYRTIGRLDDARATVKSLLEQDPENREYKRYELILMEDVEGQAPDDRIVEFINEEKDDLTRFVALASFYNSRGNAEETRAYLDKAEALRPEDPGILQKQFGMALTAQDWERANKYARRDGELNLDGTEGKISEGRLAMARGYAEKVAGREAEAREYYEQAIDLMKVGLQKYRSYSLGWTYLSQAYLAADRIDEAKDVLARAIDVDPTNGHAHRALARIAAQEGNEVAEREHLAAAQKTLPSDSWIKSRLQFYEEKENPSEGIAIREKRRAGQPDDTDNLVALARLYGDEQIGQYEKAAETYREALKLSKGDLPLAREVAAFFASDRVGQPSDGETLLKDMLRHEEDLPRKALIAASLGQFYESQKHLATADRYYRLAVSLNPSKESLAIAADFYSRTGRLNDALEYYERTLELADNDPVVDQSTRSRIVAVLLAMGDLDRAKSKVDDFLARYPNDPQAMIYEGAYHRIGGDINKAREAFDRHLEKEPDNATALWQRGQLYLLLGRWEKAIQDLKGSRASRPDAFEYKHRIALADALVEAGRGDEAVVELRSILETHPEAQDVAEALVDVYKRVIPARLSDAEDLVYRYMRMFPRDYKWPQLLGELGRLSKDHEKEIEGYQKAAELGLYQPKVVRPLFLAYKDAGQFRRIIQYATEKLAAEALEQDPELLTTLGWAYLKAGRQEEGSQAYSQALAVTGKDFAEHTVVVSALAKTLGPQAALEWAQSVAKLDPSNVDTRRALVHLFKMNDKTDLAIAECDRIMEMTPGDANMVFAHLAKGMLLNSLDRAEEAKSQYEAALKIDPDQPVALNNLAYLLAKRLNKPAEALPYAKRASRVLPQDDNVLDTYGWVLSLNGKLGDAAGTLLRALEIKRDNLDATIHLGMVCLKQKDLEEARFRLNRAKELAEAQGRTDELPKIIKALKEVDDLGG